MKYAIIILSALSLNACGYAESPEKLERKVSYEENAQSVDVPAGVAQKTKQERRDFEADGTASMALDNANGTLAPSENLVADRMMIWTANLEFEVNHLDNSFESIRRLCQRHEAYIADMHREENSYELTNYVTIRVSQKHFHDLVAAIKGESKHLDVASVSSQDVTEEFVDIENRLDTKRKARERYIEILRSKTGSIEEVIQAEEAIRRITEEIEAKEGRLRYLQDQMELSTITIRMYKQVTQAPVAAAEVVTYGDKAASSFEAGWNVIKAIGLLLVAMWPLLLILFTLMIWKRKWIVKTFHLKRRIS